MWYNKVVKKRIFFIKKENYEGEQKMGTRHMIGVIKGGEYKVGQYGQWDGYPEGQGYDVLNFLRTVNLEELKKKIDCCQFITKEKLREYYVEAGDKPDNTNGFVELSVAERVSKEHPEISRDTGAGILDLIMKVDDNDVLYLVDSHDFLEDETFCEFAYVIDLDKEILICYAGSPNDIFGEYDLGNVPDNEKMLEDYKKWYKEKNNEDY